MWIPFFLVPWVSLVPAAQLQPTIQASGDGRWQLSIEPESRAGTGSASYTMKRDGAEAWKAVLPFALREAMVADDGRVAGYAYRGATPEASSGGTLRIVLLSPEGSPLHEEKLERESSRYPHMPAVPTANGLFLQPELGRFVVRIDDGDLNRQAEEWWSFALGDGEPLGRSRPKEILRLEQPVGELGAACAVPGTPLVLLQWSRLDVDREPWQVGTLFQLVDGACGLVWSLALPMDYGSGDGAQDFARFEELAGTGILAVEERAFALQFVAEGVRARFALEQEDERWVVRELGRERLDPEKPAKPSTRTLAPGRRVLLAAAPVGVEIRDIVAFGFDAQSRLRFARAEPDGSDSLVLLDEAGTPLRSTQVPLIESSDDMETNWFPLSSGRWLRVVEGYDGRAAKLTLVHEDGRPPVPLPGPGFEEVDAVADLAPDLFVALGTRHPRYAPGPLVAFDENGQVRWEVDGLMGVSGAGDDLCVTSDGRIVVEDDGDPYLRIFDVKGEFVQRLSLREAWARSPRYVSGICADREGGFIVCDSQGKPLLQRMDREGRATGGFAVRRADGQELSVYSSNLAVAPNGELWTTDGHEFLRVDDFGLVDRQFGSPEDARELVAPGMVQVDSSAGRILIHDMRTSAIHVFDGSGERVTIARPLPVERKGSWFPLALAAAPDGCVYAGEGQWRVDRQAFGPGGMSLGRQRWLAHLVFHPRDGSFFGVSGSHIERRDPAQKKLARIERRPDGGWFRAIEDLAVSARGGLAVLDLPKLEQGLWRQAGIACVALYAPDGSPLRLLELPGEIMPDEVAWQGERVLVSENGRAWLLDAQGGVPVELVLPEEARACGLSQDGEELWAIGADGRSFTAYPLAK